MDEVAKPQPLTDAELKVLAHPLRVRMIEALATGGPSTATQLAARFGETSGSTSYHLRQLARHGFVEEDEGRGTARERWWRVKRRGWRLPGHQLRQGETRHQAKVLLHEIQRGRLERLQHWFETLHEWDESWAEAAGDADARVRLTRDELARLAEELVELVLRYARLHDDPAAALPGGALVDLQLYAFPLKLLDAPQEPPPDH